MWQMLLFHVSDEKETHLSSCVRAISNLHSDRENCLGVLCKPAVPGLYEKIGKERSDKFSSD